jgi:hypothetical protein
MSLETGRLVKICLPSQEQSVIPGSDNLGSGMPQARGPVLRGRRSARTITASTPGKSAGGARYAVPLPFLHEGQKESFAAS